MLDSEPESYWSTEIGIQMRLEMLGNEISWGSFNNAIKVCSSNYGVNYFKMIGPIDSKTCDYCATYLGRTYRLGQFMPDLPAHPNCRHWWDVWFPEK